MILSPSVPHALQASTTRRDAYTALESAAFNMLLLACRVSRGGSAPVR
jgi:hypothetical protein